MFCALQGKLDMNRVSISEYCLGLLKTCNCSPAGLVVIIDNRQP
ncbi:hypothetical protein D1BOALGB6SA_1795 [Olavius sp. associated proteobacterium Delta 1]|nr:hypothetical protein D1BOALGB6SA_1795 [Olavius sp. associated proteobacterium Delta 1]